MQPGSVVARRTAERAAATRLGITHEEWLDHRGRGEKWCTGCKAWHLATEFSRDAKRGDGRAPACRAHKRTVPRGQRYPEHDRARHAVERAVLAGRLPRPRDLPCTDCGHVGEDPRHEYDHHLGYDSAHWLDVEVVCAVCHKARERGRR